MAGKKKRFYTLYAYYPGDVTSSYGGGGCKPFILRIRAKSIKQAYYLAGSVQAAEYKGVGIVQVRNSNMSDEDAWEQFFGCKKEAVNV